MEKLLNNGRAYGVELKYDSIVVISDEDGQARKIFKMPELKEAMGKEWYQFIDGFNQFNRDEETIYYEWYFEPAFESHKQFAYFCEDVAINEYFKTGETFRVFQELEDAVLYADSNGGSVHTLSDETTLVAMN